MNQQAWLALEDGTVYKGYAFGATGEVSGEVVFNTSMTGYQEILTDPSYKGQIVTMTYPEIGNYGVNEEDAESQNPHIEGFIVRSLNRRSSNFRSTQDLDGFLSQHGILGIGGIDTRALVRHIRLQGAMKGVLSTTETDEAALIQKAKQSPDLIGRDLVREVIRSEPYSWNEKLTPWGHSPHLKHEKKDVHERFHIAAVDFGMKWNIARHLRERGCRVTVIPGTSSAEEIMHHKPDGVFLSNGPGDPRPLQYAVNAISDLIGQVPIFGICLGHQLLGLAAGAEIFKLKFGHRGSNQPVLNQETGQIEITSQNHGFAVRTETLPESWNATHINLNDQTLEGMQHRQLPIFSVQYHPEASAGPHDSWYLFDRFMKMVKNDAITS